MNTDTNKQSGYFLKAIPSIYKEIEFRSLLEVNYARFFDFYNIKWEYEMEGYDLDGVWYLPDFWLPKIKTFFEVKGIMRNIEKPFKLAKALEEDDYEWHQEIMVLIGDPYGRIITPLYDNEYNLSMAKCAKCGEYWFYLEEGSYQCRNCGEHRGDHHLRDVSYPEELSFRVAPFVIPQRRRNIRK
jgi:hypothetical protein